MARALQNRLSHLLANHSTPSCLQASQLHRSGGGVSQRFWNLLSLERSRRADVARRDPATKPDCPTTPTTSGDSRAAVLKGGKPSVGELLSEWCCRFDDKFPGDKAPQLPYYRHRAPRLPRRPCSQAPFCPTRPCPPEPRPEPKPCDACEEPKPACPPKSCAPCTGKRPPCPKPAKPCGTCRKPKPKPCPEPRHAPPRDPCKKPKSCISKDKCPRPYPTNPCEKCPRLPTCDPPGPCPPCPRPKPSCPKRGDPCRPRHTPMGSSVPTREGGEEGRRAAMTSSVPIGGIGMTGGKGITRSQMRGFHKSTTKSDRSNDGSSGRKTRKRSAKRGKKTQTRKDKAVRSGGVSSGKVLVKLRGKRGDARPKKGPTSDETDSKLK